MSELTKAYVDDMNVPGIDMSKYMESLNKYILDTVHELMAAERRREHRQIGQITAMLADQLGGWPHDLLFTDPDMFKVVFDLRPLMRILGGKWAEVVERAEEIKKQNAGGASKRGIVTEGEEGSFLGKISDSLKKVKP